MIYKVCCLKDRAADCFGQPIFANSTGSAIRSFSDEINRADNKTALAMHPEDFDLYLLGTFDDNTAEFDLCRPTQIAIGKDQKISA